MMSMREGYKNMKPNESESSINMYVLQNLGKFKNDLLVNDKPDLQKKYSLTSEEADESIAIAYANFFDNLIENKFG